MDINVFMIMNVHIKIYGNHVRSTCLCILVSNCMPACHLSHDVNVLSEEGIGYNRWVRIRGKNKLSEEGIGCNRWCEDGAKYIIGGRDRV